MAFAFAAASRRDATYHAPPRPRRLRLHARVRRPAPLPAGPGVGPGVGRRRSRPTAGPPTAATATGAEAADGLRLGRRRRGAARGGRRLPRRAPAPRARGPALRARASPTTTASPGPWVSAAGSPPNGPARTGARPLGRRRSARAHRGAARGPTRRSYAVATTMMVARVIEAVGSRRSSDEIVPQGRAGEVTIALGHDRARGRLRRGRGADPGRPRRRRVGDRRPEDVHHQRPPRRLRLPAGPHQPRRASATRASPRSSCRWTARASRCRRCTRCRASGRTSPTTATCASTTAGASATSTGAGSR